ncbi:hypothetical protein Kpol_1061p35 [Vanderwaltozyma polyspora DSM 70294]|uniref:Uncharacterized protein n=1 Tax=Vanderwaltozyma polyspora (strain ATCC 22028 / DSM 70294 / BCRC 21397 / CBS 2163 / NBRC 10782 / NRRL Y-8283 / UCD 57-17) TaxID=436907 RepID=A7TJG0_VANPO|nr:uncharacterized protein Kpol_1061p35 [Vanderwaltozyma polyspora DSM 70294]EDO17610.1 hypothetical protein Kpol_1061p35 [Vanderwaltozyma polyspora DSM 70294]
MNLLLQDPFSVLKEYPERLSHTLENPLHTECIKFSPVGDYLALGSSNGGVIIYDMDTFKPITVLGTNMGSHTRSIQSISWSPCGRYIITSSRDWFVKLWDLDDPGKNKSELSFDSPVWNCEWFDFEDKLAVATVFEEQNAFLIDFKLEPPTVYQIEDRNDIEMENGNVNNKGYTLTLAIHPKLGNIVITGTSKGWINIFQIQSLSNIKLVHSFKIGNYNIKHIIISENGDKLGINSSDRTIRQYSLKVSNDTANEEKLQVEIDLTHKYQDVINKLQWNSIFFSNNSAEYIVASTHGSSAHELYIWETSSGTLVRVLEGSEEELMDIDWNFYNMCLASNGLESGDVYIWSIVVPPKWSALAPDFEEVEDNVNYQEKEDEFDQAHEYEQQRELIQLEEVEIDLKTREQYDVRGNDLLLPNFTIPPDYQRTLLLQYKNSNK